MGLPPRAPRASINRGCNLSFFSFLYRRRIPDRPGIVALCELLLGVFPFFLSLCDSAGLLAGPAPIFVWAPQGGTPSNLRNAFSVRGAYLKRGRYEWQEGFLPFIQAGSISRGEARYPGREAGQVPLFPNTPRGCFSFFLRSASGVRGANLKGCCE